MKSVLISINPKWCKLIAQGKKTIEVRKSRPKIDVPFKCYIYETMGLYKGFGGCLFKGCGKVIGEFVCDEIIKIGNYQETDHSYMLWVKDRETTNKLCKNACLDEFEIQDYLGANGGFGWHISNLVIYDKPKELKDFRKPDSIYMGRKVQGRTLARPPQSWQFVEETGV